MALSATVTPGKRFQAAEKANNAKLNQLGQPTVAILGVIAATDMNPGDFSTALAPGPYFYGVDVGGPNAAIVTVTPPVTKYVDGLVLAFKVGFDNTGPATLGLNGLAPQPVKQNGFLDLGLGDWKQGLMVECRYRLDADLCAGLSYGAGGTIVLPLVIGWQYAWAKGANDTQITDGTTTLVNSGTFTAASTSATITGTANFPLTCTLTAASNYWEMLSQTASNVASQSALLAALKFL